MTSFDDFSIIYSNLVEFFTGSYGVLAVTMIFFFIIILMSLGMDFRYASIFILPLLAAFVSIGWFVTLGDAQLIVNIGLIIVSVFYAFAVLKLTT